jgi:eukaryotic-like serine/threonine-protein kinase
MASRRTGNRDSEAPSPQGTLPGEPPPTQALTKRAKRSAPLLGTVFAETYRLDRIIGEGAMGIVYLAHDLRLERDVALKIVHPEYVATPDAAQRFLYEARTMARVRHENVVEIYAFGEDRVAGEERGVPYFVMEYVPGRHVEDWLRSRREPPAIDEALGILEQVCRGVSAIHAAGTVHRDLKWTNVLIGPAFRVAVADLGLARVLDRRSHEPLESFSGTPAYMAPEVVLGTPLPVALHARADVYSLGVMAFELLTLRLPYVSDDGEAMMRLHVEARAPTPSEIRPELPPAFDAVILKALSKNVDDRYASVEELREALLAARQDASEAKTRQRFLVADDDEDFCALATAILEEACPGAEVVVVHDGDAALAATDRDHFSLALLDLDMPGMNGIELTAALRAATRTESLPILVATATGGAPDWRLLASLGADGFVVKPIDPLALVALVRRTLQKASEPRGLRSTGSRPRPR